MQVDVLEYRLLLFDFRRCIHSINQLKFLTPLCRLKKSIRGRSLPTCSKFVFFENDNLKLMQILLLA